jgi:hypothetical protein
LFCRRRTFSSAENHGNRIVCRWLRLVVNEGIVRRTPPSFGGSKFEKLLQLGAAAATARKIAVPKGHERHSINEENEKKVRICG